MNIQELDAFLSKLSSKPNMIFVHPSRCTWSKDLERVCIETPLGFSCLKYFEDLDKYIYIGDAMNLDDGKEWTINNKEIEMWT